MKFLETVRFHMADKDFERRFDKVNWELRRALKSAIRKNDAKNVLLSLKGKMRILWRGI